ncbi:MAG: hypothetical protein E7161_03710, partial [Firmicutes bacterium]|nr:hypothetical protein [Bacillota bacterium]
MNKKNTMLLTVIAVATLLVAVVGATFAYFTASNNASGTTVIETSTKAVGSITLTGGKEMHLTLLENDMTQSTAGASGKVFWATAGDDNYVADREEVAVSTLNISGGEDTTNYSCSYTLTVVKTGDAALLEAGDAELYVTANNATITGLDTTNAIDITELEAKDYTVSFTRTGNTKVEGGEIVVSAAMKFTNKSTKQDYFAGKDFGVSFENSSLNCQVVERDGKNLSETIIALTEVEDSGVYHETVTDRIIGTYSTVSANASSWSSMTLGEGVTITSEAEGAYQLSVSCDDGGNCTPPSSTSTFKPLNSGYYKVLGGESIHLIFDIYVDGQNVYNYHPYGESSGSRDLGYLTPENTITISITSAGSQYDEVDNTTFKISYATIETVNLDSYRYEGAEVNNYVTFNDETWRIIGVEEGSTIGLTSGEYYTKIIRSETLGNFAYDYGAFSDATEWRYTQPNNFLNLGYYNKQEYFDESFGTTIDAGFTTNGLTEESRGMITQPTWRGLYYDNVTTTSATYFYEKTSGRSSSGYVGLMSPSDYGYAALQSECASTQ